MTPNFVSPVVLPLCWPLQADQLQRDQTGVYGPPHLLHWPGSGKYSFCSPEWNMGNTAGLNRSVVVVIVVVVISCTTTETPVMSFLKKHRMSHMTKKCSIFTITTELLNLRVRIRWYTVCVTDGCHNIHKWCHVDMFMSGVLYNLHSHWHFISFETVSNFCYRIWKLLFLNPSLPILVSISCCVFASFGCLPNVILSRGFFGTMTFCASVGSLKQFGQPIWFGMYC